jgi:hypothetical protein
MIRTYLEKPGIKPVQEKCDAERRRAKREKKDGGGVCNRKSNIFIFFKTNVLRI